MKKGQRNIIIVKPYDIRNVYILSTVHDNRMVDKQAAKGALKKTKPLALMCYNKCEVSVGKSDQLLAYSSFQRMSVKWWRKIVVHLFDLELVN